MSDRRPTIRARAAGSRSARSLQALAVVVVLLIVGATAHQLLTGRALIIADTERQMARLDMVFAEQTGRAVETVDFMLRNAIENLQALRAAGQPPGRCGDAYIGSCWRAASPGCARSARSRSPTRAGMSSIRRSPARRTSCRRRCAR